MSETITLEDLPTATLRDDVWAAIWDNHYSKELGLSAVYARAAEQSLERLTTIANEAKARCVELEAALREQFFTAYNQGVEDCKAAIRGVGTDNWEGSEFKPYFITEIARTCSPHQYQNKGEN